MGDDGVVLTDRERQALAGLAESIGDPWLARQLTGQEAAPPAKKRRFPGSAGFAAALRRATAGWVGLALLVAGAAIALVTFTFSTAVASLGLALMGFGVWRVAVGHGAALMNRWTARQSRTAAEPQPPRTPPAAV